MATAGLIVDDLVRIETPEGVDLDVQLANVGSRMLAAVVDELVKSAILFALFLAFGALAALDLGPFGLDADNEDAQLGWIIAILVLVVFVWTFLYDVAFEVLNGGRTPGKMALGIRVVQRGARPVGFLSSSIRNLCRIIDALPTMYGVGMTSVLVTKRNQRLGDLAAGTMVIRDRRKDAPGAPDPAAPRFVRKGQVAPAPWLPSAGNPAVAAGWDLSGVSARDLSVVNAFLSRRASLTPSARASVAADLASRLRARTAGVPERLDDEAFLEALAAGKAARG